MGLLPSNAIVENGHVILNEEEDLLTYNDNKMSHIRGKKVSMIFQEPMKALDPVFTIGNQMEETVRRHNKGVKKAEARARCLEMLKKVEIANPEHVLKCYPHELSRRHETAHHYCDGAYLRTHAPDCGRTNYGA